MFDNRGQAYTLQGIVGAILIASALVVGLQAVDISPFTDDSADVATDELRIQSEDMLAIASDRDSLRTIATCVDGDGDGTPHPAVAPRSVSDETDQNSFGALLNQTLTANGYSYNVYIDYVNTSSGGQLDSTPLASELDVTRPSVTVTHHVTLFDSDHVHIFDSERGECVPTIKENNTLGERDDDDIYLENKDEDSEIYAVVQIRVVAW